MANERELCAENVQSGTWLYDNQGLSEVWIVKQNFEFHYEPDFPDGPEELNADGETFQVVIARDGLPKCNVFCPPITIKEEFIIEEIRGMPYITTGLTNGGRTQFFTFQYDSALTQARGLDFGK